MLIFFGYYQYQYPNWQQKMAWTVEQLWEDEKPLSVAAKVRAILVETGRAAALDS